MSVVCRIRCLTMCYSLFFFILIAVGPDAGPTHAQVQPQNPLANKNFLVLHAHEAMAPIFEKTDSALSAASAKRNANPSNQAGDPDPTGTRCLQSCGNRYAEQTGGLRSWDYRKDHQGTPGPRDAKNGRSIPCRPRSLCRKAGHPFLDSPTLLIGPKSNSNIRKKKLLSAF